MLIHIKHLRRTPERILIVATYYAASRSVIIVYWVSKTSVEEDRPCQHNRLVRTKENVIAVSVCKNSSTSMVSFTWIGKSSTPLRWILHIDLHLHPYKMQLTQDKLADPHNRVFLWIRYLQEKKVFFKTFFFLVSTFSSKKTCQTLKQCSFSDQIWWSSY